MKIEFTHTLPEETKIKPILISGAISTGYSGREFLRLIDEDLIERFFEIKYEFHCSPFKEAFLIDNMLAVGHEEHFYLFNLTTNENTLRLVMNGYFGHLYYNKEIFYVADAYGIHCIDKNGKILWWNNELGIDGVVIHDFIDNKILGCGEFDPPGGWVDFSIDNMTGERTI
jgi:hypothetical protein